MLCALHGVQSAGQRLGERGVGRREVLADLVDQRLNRVDHVGRHAPGVAPPKAKHVVGKAHPVLTALAIAAIPAGDDLLGDHPVAHGHAPALRRLLVELDDLADELMARDHVGLGPGRPVLVAPELGRPVVALQVAGADAHGLDADERLALAPLGHRHLLEPVVLGPMADDGLHRLGNPTSW